MNRISAAKRTNPMSADRLIDEWISFCDRYAPGFSSKLQPSSSVDLFNFQKLVGCAIPEELTAFLRRMGKTSARDLAPLFKGYSFGLSAARAYYRKRTVYPSVWKLRKAIFFAEITDYDPLFVSRKGAGPANRPLIQYGFKGKTPQANVYESSLLAFLYRRAFIDLAMPTFRFRSSLWETEASVKHHKPNKQFNAKRKRILIDYATRRKFKPLPFVRGDLNIFISPSAFLYFSQEAYAKDTLYLGAQSQASLHKLEQSFRRLLDMYEN